MKYRNLSYKVDSNGLKIILKIDIKGGFKSEDTGEFLHLQYKYSRSLSWAENLNFLPKTVNNLFKFSAQASDLEYLCWICKNFLLSSDLKPPLDQDFKLHSWLIWRTLFSELVPYFWWLDIFKSIHKVWKNYEFSNVSCKTKIKN